MRIAYLADRYTNPNRSRSWSGVPFFARRALEDAGAETVVVPLEESRKGERWARFLYWRYLRGRRYARACDARLLRGYARQAEKRLSRLSVDAVFGTSSSFFSYLRTDLPTVFWTDACFAGMLDFYPSFSRLAPTSVEEGHAAEREALSRCHKALYTSDWAARSAKAHYKPDPDKVEVVPFGGNLLEPPSIDQVAVSVAKRDRAVCQLLLVGVDWQRKGVDIAISATEALIAKGQPARLTIVGCRPPQGAKLPASVEVIPFVGKDRASDRQWLYDAFARSHFFIMPSRAEAYGLVFAEANAFGVPCLATDIGGISSIVTDGVNGRLFPCGASGDQYAEHILGVLRDRASYTALALRSAEEAANRLSWRVSGRKVAKIIEDLVTR